MQYQTGNHTTRRATLAAFAAFAGLALTAPSAAAKVSRDRCMERAGLRYPEYGFEGHKGYASEAHREAIVKHGPSPIHRMSFNSPSYSGH